MVGKVKQFFAAKSSLWSEFLSVSISSVLYQENKNLWIFQKLMYSCLVIIMQFLDAQVVQNAVISLLNVYEKSDARKSQILEQFLSLMQQQTFTSIDQKSKDKFFCKFA